MGGICLLDFRYLELEDRAWLQPLLAASGNIGSESAFGSLMIWGGDYRVKVSKGEENIFLSFGETQHSYYFPTVYRDLREALQLLIADAKERGISFRMWGLNDKHIKLMDEALPNTFSYELDRGGSDYIYSVQDLAELKGRKYEKKRNHLSRFRRTYQNVTYEGIKPENIADCINIAEEWREANLAYGSTTVNMEYCAFRKAVDNFAALHLSGGLIRIEGKPVAFTIGEEINPKVFLLHFEKALEAYDGLYAAINQEFAACCMRSYELVNREEDMDLEGLRKAKLSYHPVKLLEKYAAVLRSE